jgi:type VI secretion system FHA domain protein
VTLILEITSPLASGVVARHVFHEEGGSIGRETSNTWALPHSKVSGLHAVITFRDGTYFIEDRSRNGVRLNSPRNRLERERPYALTAGDSILIEPYTIRVSIGAPTHDERGRAGTERHNARRPQAELDDPFGVSDPADPFAPRPIDSLGSSITPEDVPRQALDPMELLNLAAPNRPPARKVRTGQDLQEGSLLDEVVKVPAAVPDPARPRANPATIPEDYDPLAPDDPSGISAHPSFDELPEPRVIPQRPRVARPAPVVDPPRPPVAAPEQSAPVVSPATAPPSLGSRPVPEAEKSSEASRGLVDFAAVLKGAGLDPADVTPEIAEQFGQILRVVVAGVMDVMQSRQQIKDEFRMQVTRVRPIENNPLKFSADVDDALHNLLVKRNRAYLNPVAAFEDALADLRHHQIAMLSGMRAAFEAMLAEFDPDRMQEEFDRLLNKGLVPAKLRYWDLYRDKRREMAKDPEASFRRLFGEAFARAYEEQLSELKAHERGSSRAGSTNRTPTDK